MRRTKEDSQKTRESILSAAVQAFAEKGVAETSLEEIAEAANVTRGAIYWHFKNKMEIFDALHKQLHQPVVEMIMQDIEKNHPQPLEQMRQLCLNFLLDLEKNQEKRQVLMLFMIKCDYSGELAVYRGKHRKRKQENIRLFSLYFKKAKDKGLLPANADPKLLTLSLTCYIKGIVLEYLQDPDSFPMSRTAPKLINPFFCGLGKR